MILEAAALRHALAVKVAFTRLGFRPADFF